MKVHGTGVWVVLKSIVAALEDPTPAYIERVINDDIKLLLWFLTHPRGRDVSSDYKKL